MRDTADVAVSVRLTASVVGSKGSGMVLVDLQYRPADPYAFTVTADGVTWLLSRDVLADGLRGPAGAGNATVRPTAAGAYVRVTLTNSGGWAVLTMRRHIVAAFVAATHRCVPRGDERVDVDGWLAAITATGETT
jgi:hypothetical protein